MNNLCFLGKLLYVGRMSDADRNSAGRPLHLVAVHTCASNAYCARSFENNLVADTYLVVRVYNTGSENASFGYEVVYLDACRAELARPLDARRKTAVSRRKGSEMLVVGFADDTEAWKPSFDVGVVKYVARAASELVVAVART